MRRAAATLVIPLKRQSDVWLRQCVLSAVDQSVLCETIVVTHPDTPQSNLQLLADMAEARSNLHVLCPPPARSEFAGAINVGFESANAPRVGLVLSDDWLAPRAVERCLGHAASIVSTSMFEHGAAGEVLGTNRISHRRFSCLESLEAKADYLGHFFLFERDAVLDAGGVDETIGLTGADDYDLIWTLLERGAGVSIVEEPLYHYRDHDDERLTLRPREKQVADLMRILDKHGVHGTERERIVAKHARWYGKPMHAVARRRGGGEGRPDGGA